MISQPADSKPAFIITLDTEGDNLWEAPVNEAPMTKNVRFLPRFQALCEKYNYCPTYLTNYEVAINSEYQEFAKDFLSRQTGEVGMHLHAWNSPPLQEDDLQYKSYLIEYPEDVMREKVDHITNLLEDIFQTDIRSHRAGRWAFNETYARILLERGYHSDCSVTPGISWISQRGGRRGVRGSDYTLFPREEYFIDLSNIGKVGDSNLLEVPVTCCLRNMFIYKNVINKIPSSLVKGIINKIIPGPFMLRPNGNNLQNLIDILRNGIDTKAKYVMFMIHSSELMPGGSPKFRNEADIDKLYDDLEELFAYAAVGYQGMTLEDYYARSTSH